VLLFLLACEPDHDGEGVPGTLVRARLEHVVLSTYFLVVGGLGGEADLVVRNDADDRFVAPVQLDGFVAGGVLEGSVAIGGPIRMFLPDDEVTARPAPRWASGARPTSRLALPIAPTPHVR
jgi:hypothetical protein